MAAKKKAPSAATISKKQMAARQRVIDRSRNDVEKAHRNLELKLKKHKRVLSAMFFIP
ncbi:MAG TPA: hypothetical protein VJU15_16740 [Gemmatimonadales bacterium]|nr:hypothetical protein [Gemmatimonadales bacterium]